MPDALHSSQDAAWLPLAMTKPSKLNVEVPLKWDTQTFEGYTPIVSVIVPTGIYANATVHSPSWAGRPILINVVRIQILSRGGANGFDWPEDSNIP